MNNLYFIIDLTLMPYFHPSVKAEAYPLSSKTQLKIMEYCIEEADNMRTNSFRQCWVDLEAKAFKELKWCNAVDPENPDCAWGRMREMLY